MKEKKHIIDVVPLTRISLSGNQSFSYLSSEKIYKGSLVSVPLFKRKVGGVVIGNQPDFPRNGNIKLKKIEEIIEEDFLDEKQIVLAKFISDYYFSSLGTVLKLFVPKRVRARANKEQEARSKEQKNIILTKEQQEAVKKITTNYKPPASSAGRQTTNFLLFGPPGSGKTEIYINSILKIKEKNPKSQFLILLPEIMLVPQAIERYGIHFKPEEMAVINSKISKGKIFDYFQRIKSGEIKIIIGSRMALFMPFKKLDLIVVDEEQDISFKQWDMNPRYDARKVAEKLAEIKKSKIIFGSSTPRLETYQKAKNKEYELIEIPPLDIPEVKFSFPEIFLADMRKERWKNQGGRANLSCLSRKLQSEIAYVLKNKLQAILFINRQGMSAFSVCLDCKTVLKCPKCYRALIYDKAGFYKCLQCSYQTSIIPECSKCKGISFKNVGLGTQKIEKEVNNIFPGARIAIADNQTMKGARAQEKIYRDFSEGKIDILIGTQMISKGWDLPNVALVGIIDADSMLTFPDFSALERAFQNIYQVSGRTNRPGAVFRGMVVIQTFNPENYLFKAILEKDVEKFLEKELIERKYLDFPPFGKIIKLVFQDRDLQKTKKATQGVYALLKKMEDRDIKISEVHAPLVSRVRGKFRQQIIIKIKNPEQIPEKIINPLKQLSANWIIDVDPISIA